MQSGIERACRYVLKIQRQFGGCCAAREVSCALSRSASSFGSIWPKRRLGSIAACKTAVDNDGPAVPSASIVYPYPAGRLIDTSKQLRWASSSTVLGTSIPCFANVVSIKYFRYPSFQHPVAPKAPAARLPRAISSLRRSVQNGQVHTSRCSIARSSALFTASPSSRNACVLEWGRRSPVRRSKLNMQSE